MKTIREIANELGVDKQKVYRFIKQNHINEAHHEALQRSSVKYYDEAAETLIKQGFSDETASSEAHHEAHQNRINEAVFDAVIEMLQKELEIKNEQIKELNERLSECSAALQELADMQEKKTELKGEIKSLSGTVAALKAAERVRVDFDTIRPEKTLTGAVKGVTVEQIQQLKEVAMTGAAAKQTVVALNKKNASLEKEKAEMREKIPSVHEKMEAAAQRSRLENQNRQLWSENKELKAELEEERSFSDRLLEGIDRVLDMLERHLPKQLLHLVDKARELLPDHQTYSQEKPHERGHSWGDMSL